MIDLGGGLGVRHNRDEHPPEVAAWVQPLVARLREQWPEPAQVVFEPGRSLVVRAGVSLYRVGVVKDSGGVSYAAIDGGMSDNPRPQLYGARYEALLANRADELTTGVYRIAGKHCESGDVLIEAVELPEPVRGDLLAVPATGAYTLALSSNYNGVPRPEVVLVRDGETRDDPAARDRSTTCSDSRASRASGREVRTLAWAGVASRVVSGSSGLSHRSMVAPAVSCRTSRRRRRRLRGLASRSGSAGRALRRTCARRRGCRRR